MIWLTRLWLKIRIYVLAIGAVLSAVGAALFAARQSGKKDSERDATLKDFRRADNIRERVDRNLDDRVRKHDDSGWRDAE